MTWWRRAAGPAVVALILAVPSGPALASGCATGASCFTTDDKGKLDPTGKYTTQCSGRFADYVDLVPESYDGRRFTMSQQYPAKKAPAGSSPWSTIDFKTEAGAVEYMMKLREYIYEGMEAADWRIDANAVRKWYHVPWMHVGRNPREFVRGVTRERSLAGPELGIKPGVTVQNYAVGFYNDVGAPTIGAVWKNAAAPDPKRAQSANGTVVAKVLFSAAQPTDFQNGDILDGAPAWDANIFVRFPAPDKNIKPVRLIQMDVGVRDPRAGETGWVFGTFVYDRSLTAQTPWNRMVPLGLMWGNDPTLTKAAFEKGARPKETLVNPAAPAYARAHLGLSGRMNGPVDNPVSACLGCHSTAQVPASTPMFPFATCSEPQALHWFRNIPGTRPFGGVTQSNCTPVATPAGFVSLDYSLQQSVAFQNIRNGAFHNTCADIGPSLQIKPKAPAAAPSGTPYLQYPVTR